jgi:hypothetical protein
MDAVVIIHGTFSSKSDWWLSGSDFCNKLNERLVFFGGKVLAGGF